jgi:chromosomal replication initiation ATPase DnaA
VNPKLHPGLRFEEFVIGSGNRLAATAARAVAESPGAVYNPLFIYAAPGLGKTHLLTAVGHSALAINPGLAVAYLTLDDFVETFHAAIAAGQGDAYRRRYSELGLLLLDDVQALARRREMQSELLRVVDAMQASGGQIVLASDRPPADIEALDDRLLRRFGGGLVVDVGAPDYETRVAILRRKADARGLDLAPGVLEAAAQIPLDNVRELLGALNRLGAAEAAAGRPLSVPEARAELAGIAGLVASRTGGAIGGTPGGGAGAEDPEGETDEFTDFLQEIVSTVSQQVESWRSRVAEAVLRWSGEGFRTTRLEQLLDNGALPQDPDGALAAFSADVSRLQQIARDLERVAPDLAGDQALRDPDQVVAAAALLERAREGLEPPSPPSPHWLLDEVLESPANRVAVRAARAVAAEPGTRYNPLLISATSGNGKTHVLHGVGNALAAAGLTVACVGAHEFVEELIAAIDQDVVPRWRARWRRADALLIDDVHLLADKERSQEELFLLFNEFHDHRRQMVFTTGVPLAELSGMAPRLLTRFEGGLVVELPPPDRDLRQRVAERHLAARLEQVDPELPGYIGSRPAESFRAALGTVQRVLQAAEAKGVPPSAALAREVLDGASTGAARRTAPPRPNGVTPLVSGGIRSREKMVWEWPEVPARLIEEWR